MKKKLALMFFVGLSVVTIGLVASSNNLPISANTKSNLAEISVSNKGERDIFQSVEIKSDFAKIYNLEQLSAEGELIAYGTINEVKSFVDENRRIYTNFNFEVDEILKGKFDIPPQINVNIQGGSVTYAEYFNASKEVLKEKLSPEDFEKALEESKQIGNTKYIEEVFNGVENVNDGDKVLLFLVMDVEQDVYYVVGSSYYGVYSYNVNDESFSRIDRDSRARTNITLDKEQLKKIIENTDDVSEQIKREQRTRTTIKKNAEELEKDSAFDPYKE